MGRLVSLSARLRWTILIVLVAACQRGQPPLFPDAGVAQPAFIDATSNTVAIPPGGNRQLGFRLRDAHGDPVAGAVLSFEILDRETPGSGGALLSLSSGLTDEQGLVTLQVIAGAGSKDQKPLTFYVKASVAQLAFILPIFVTSGALVSAEIVPIVEDPAIGEDAVSSISLYFYEDTVCTDVDWERPATSIWPMSTISPGQSWVFDNVVASGVHAVLAVALGARNSVVGWGCADLPGSSLSAAQVMRVLLPLARMHVSPVGTYSV